MARLDAKSGIISILSQLNNEELNSLASTVTQGLLKNKITTRKEAISAILKYSPNITSILKRKAITKEMLFKYLHDNNIDTLLPGTKNSFVEKICEIWNINQEVALRKEEPPRTSSEQMTQNNEYNVEELATKFGEWFYNILNTSPCIGSEHFWSDSQIKLNLIADNEKISEFVEGSEQSAYLFSKTKHDHNLYFNPNLSKDGVRGRIDPHGLVIVAVCGTLHCNDMCVGVFEQMFSLARDPFSDNNWKIKFSELNLRRKSGINSYPILEESDVLSIEPS